MLVRQDKRNTMDKLATDSQKAAIKGEQSKVYNITKLFCGKSKDSINKPLKDKQKTY